MTVAVDVLIPTCERPAALAVTLTALAASTAPPLRIVVSDQSESAPAAARPEVAAVLRYLRARGIAVDVIRHLPRRGMAEQRAFLLAQASAPYCLYLDDDVIVEPDLLARLHAAILAQGCGFVGSAVHGLIYLGQGLLRAALSLRQDCPVCGAPNLSTRCAHDASFVADVPVGQVVAMAADLVQRAPCAS